MATIYLIEQGTTLAKDHQRFIIKSYENERIEVQIREVERIVVFGNIHLTTPVINSCLENNIVILFANQSGQYKGHLWSEEAVNLNFELAQINRWSDTLFQINVSRAIILGKLFNSKQILLRLNRKRKVAEVAQAIAGISMDIKTLRTVDDIDTVRGYEGIGAARYFPAFGKLITNTAFAFCQRLRQPPSDPVNSLLSFGYTILFNNVLSLIIAEGLAPYFGNLHYGERKKPYLAFDLMEEFRSPIVDSFVLKVINNSMFRLDDFESSLEGGVYLTASARRTFLKHFEQRMNEEVSHPDVQHSATYRQAIQLQIRRYKRSLISEVAYEPFFRAT